jgi:hypothetical protein
MAQNIVGPPASQPELTFHRPGRSENRSRRRVGTVSDEPKFLGILHFAQRDHHGVPFYCVVLGEKKFTRSDSTLTTRARHHSPPRRTSQS